MEFREFYRGIGFKIRFDSQTGVFTGETDGLPKDSVMQADSYDELHDLFKLAVDDHLSGRHAKLQDEWAPHAVLVASSTGSMPLRGLGFGRSEVSGRIFRGVIP